MNILEEIINLKKKEVDSDKQKFPLSTFSNRIKKKKYFFSKKLEDFKKNKKTAIIAEIKKASPSKGIICKNFNYLEIAKDYFQNGAACLSVLTEEKFFMGKKEYILEIKKKFDIPILCKDFFIDTYQIDQANSFGADCILILLKSTEDRLAKDLLKKSNELEMDSIIEVHNEKEMERALKLNAKIIGINNRNLETFEVSLDNTIRLYEKFKKNLNDKILICESGIFTKDDIKKITKSTQINNFLVGESLMKSSSISDCLKDLIK
jgi:indole-3-glycerol phosphate synthase